MADRRLIKECLANPAMWPAASLYAFKRWLGQEQIRIYRQGQVMYVGAQSGQGAWQAIAGLEYEPELRQILTRVKAGDVILDIGANIGSYTLRLARKTGPTGRVVSVEAMAKNAQFLEMNIKANHLANVTVVQAAVGATNSHVALYSKGHASSIKLNAEGGFTQVGETEMVTGDSILDRLGLARLDWIKMDIEGGEPEALRGLSRALANFRPRILFENGPTGAETIALLKGIDYAVGCFSGAGQFMESSGTVSLGNLFALPLEKMAQIT